MKDRHTRTGTRRTVAAVRSSRCRRSPRCTARRANVAYAASKAGLLGLVRTAAVELARFGIRANALLPGWTEVDTHPEMTADERFVGITTQRTPVRRWGTPDDLKPAVGVPGRPDDHVPHRRHPRDRRRLHGAVTNGARHRSRHADPPRRELACRERHTDEAGQGAAMIEDVLQYAGKRVVVTGCASGMGAATAQILVDLDAEVIGLTSRRPTWRCTGIGIDLRDRRRSTPPSPRSTRAGARSSAWPGSPASVSRHRDGARELRRRAPSDRVAGAEDAARLGRGLRRVQRRARMATGDRRPAPRGDERRVRRGQEVVRGEPRPDRAGLPAVEEAHQRVRVVWRAASLLDTGIRLNCTNPGPTDTAMMPTFEEQSGKELIDVFVGPSAGARPPRSRRGRWSSSTARGRRTSRARRSTPTWDSWGDGHRADRRVDAGVGHAVRDDAALRAGFEHWWRECSPEVSSVEIDLGARRPASPARRCSSMCAPCPTTGRRRVSQWWSASLRSTVRCSPTTASNGWLARRTHSPPPTSRCPRPPWWRTSAGSARRS